MLQLKNIIKDYGSTEKDSIVHALRDVSLTFRDNEFVSILGQSGCGKTTMLNIIGGLDRYTSGDLIIDGVSTKNYKDVDWDAYRNIRIGFIFQSYNLISHIDILSNVEMALTLSGVGVSERRERALKALREVGLEEQAKKRPNQLSGGQMQRVSIARALINNPHIILADEPTGALDSNTSIQIMDLLKEIAKNRLVIMVTHNGELAKTYSTRIVSLKDGEVIGDTNPYIEEEIFSNDNIVKIEEKITKKDQRKSEKAKKKTLSKTAMSFFTAIKLSFNNLMTKKGRTILTAIAASIGIIGVSLVLAISNGFSNYVKDMQTDMLSGYPIEIATESYDYETLMSISQSSSSTTQDKDKMYQDTQEVSSYELEILNQMMNLQIKNTLSDKYVDYINSMKKSWYGSIYYSYGMELNIIGKPNMSYFKSNPLYYSGADKNSEYQKINSISMFIGWMELTGGESFINTQYDNLYGRFPTEKNEIMLVLNESNQISELTAAALGLDPEKTYTFDELVNFVNTNKMKVYTNDAYYEKVSDTYYKAKDYEELYENETDGYIELELVGIYRPKENVSYTTLTNGICYSNALTEYMLEKNMNSEIVQAQQNSTQYVRASDGKYPDSSSSSIISSYMGGGVSITNQASALVVLGGVDTPTGINIYATSFDTKTNITQYLDAWNETYADDEAKQVKYNDMAALIASMLSQMIRILTIALTCFSSVSLIVSSVMIGIITYVSVVERTKEIGILRSLGARKKDISRVFNAETGIVGFTAGLIGVLITYILSIPINLIVNNLAGMTLNLCNLNPLAALAMILLSILLTFIAGLIPSSIAAKRDPVVALRTE